MEACSGNPPLFPGRETCKDRDRRQGRRGAIGGRESGIGIGGPGRGGRAMSFAARVTRHPIPFNPERGAEALEHLHELPPELRPLVEGTAGCSPYLGGLIRREGHWLSHALDDEPEDTIVTLLREAGDLTEGDLDSCLRRLKRRAALLVALARPGGRLEPSDGYAGLDRFRRCLPRRRTWPPRRAGGAAREDPPARPRRTRFATARAWWRWPWGKMGAGELNYSSDIDLICLFDESRFDPGDEMDARAGLHPRHAPHRRHAGRDRGRGLRLSHRPAPAPRCRGHARLHLDGGGGAVLRGRGTVLGNARPISRRVRPRATSRQAKGSSRRCSPSVWRRHLDFAMVQDTMDMAPAHPRAQAPERRGLIRRDGEVSLEGHNIKLGAGGIREIEFFAQTRQLVAGGRDPSLRDRRTVKALAALARAELDHAQGGKRTGRALCPSPGNRASVADDR